MISNSDETSLLARLSPGRGTSASAHGVRLRGKRESGKIEKAARIKEAARELFHELGFERTTIEAVAKRAGIGKGTLFSYASAKEDLLIIVFIDELLEVAMAGRRRALRCDDLNEGLYRLYGGMLQLHFKSASLSQHLVREIAYIKSPKMRATIASLVHFNRETAITLISREQSRRTFEPDVDAGLLADNCFAIFYQVLNRMLTESKPIGECRQLLRVRLGVQLTPYRIP